MDRSSLPEAHLVRFHSPGSTLQISTLMSACAPDDERYLYEGAIERVWVEGDGMQAHLCVRFAWLARRGDDHRWVLDGDPAHLDYRHALLTLLAVVADEPLRMAIAPAEPIAHESLLFMAADYVGPTDRRPLRRSDVVEG